MMSKMALRINQIGGLETAMEWLRPLVRSRAWDYCIVWKLGDDPSRFIEWMGCCCCGGESVNVKEESDGEGHVVPMCRDAYKQHPVKAKACHMLAKFPLSIPLYSGVHGDVAMSNEPSWLINSHATSSGSTHSLESNGTQVIIPVLGGLIELFTPNCVSKDQKLIGYIVSQYKASVEHESMIALSRTNIRLNEPIRKSPASSSYSPTVQNPSFEASSSASNLAHVSQDNSPTQSIEKPNFSLSRKREQESFLVCPSGSIVNKDNTKVKPKAEREQYHSKNLITERKRRTRIKDGLFALRALVPKITKMDRASILGDAVDYIHDLEKSVKKFKEELGEMAEEECNKNNADLEVPEQAVTYVRTKQTEVQVEVVQIATRAFLVKLVCNQKQGGFTRLMEAMSSLGLQVIDANVSTSNGRVLNVLKVEAETKEVEAKDLEDILRKLSS